MGSPPEFGSRSFDALVRDGERRTSEVEAARRERERLDAEAERRRIEGVRRRVAARVWRNRHPGEPRKADAGP